MFGEFVHITAVACRQGEGSAVTWWPRPVDGVGGVVVVIWREALVGGLGRAFYIIPSCIIPGATLKVEVERVCLLVTADC